MLAFEREPVRKQVLNEKPVVSHASFFGQIIFAMENDGLVTLRCRWYTNYVYNPKDNGDSRRQERSFSFLPVPWDNKTLKNVSFCVSTIT